MMTLNEREQRTVQAVFEALVLMGDRKLNTFLGSVTIEEMKNIYSKLHYAPYCEKHGIKYEDMTDEDFMDAYFEANEA